MSRDEIPPGTLYLLILKTLAVRKKLHGYEIAESIEQRSEDILQVEEGSLYPALQRMLIKGWVVAEWGVTDGTSRAGEIKRRIQMLFHRAQLQRDLEEEMRLHLELRRQEQIDRALPLTAAA